MRHASHEQEGREDGNTERTRTPLEPGQWPGQCTIGSSQVPGGVFVRLSMSLPSGMTGRLGTPMKETGGLSQPLRSLNHPNKTKYYTIILGLNRSSGEIEWREAVE